MKYMKTNLTEVQKAFHNGIVFGVCLMVAIFQLVGFFYTATGETEYPSNYIDIGVFLAACWFGFQEWREYRRRDKQVIS